MKKVFALVLAISMMVPGMGVLAEATAVPVAQTAPTANTSGELVVALQTQMSGYLYTDMWGSNTVDANLRALLHGYATVTWDETGVYRVDSNVASNLTTEDNARGDRTYTFTLATDLTYNEGTAITAADYVFSILLQSDPAVRALGGVNTQFSYVKGYANYAQSKTGVLTGVRLLGDHQFSITVPAAELPYYYEMTYALVEPSPIGVLAPGYTVRDDGKGVYLALADAQDAVAPDASPLTDALLATTLTAEDGYLHQPKITSGPYQLAAYDASEHIASLTINPLYKGNAQGRKPEIQAVKIVQMDNATALTAFANGEVQLIHNLTDADTILAARQLQSDGSANVGNHLSSGYAYVSFACEQAPLDDVNVRKAIAMCLDREVFCATLFQNNALPVYGYYGYGQWMLAQDSANLAKYDLGFDVESARALLEKSGYTYNEDGDPFVAGRGQTRCKLQGGVLMPLELRWAKTDSKAADLVKEQLTTAFNQLGVRLVIDEMSFRDMLTQYYRTDGVRQDNLFFLSEMFPYAFDPYWSYQVADEWQGAYNTTGLRDEKLMNAAQRMRSVQSGDTVDYLLKWNAFQDRWNEVMPTVPLYCNVEFDVSIPTVYDFVENARNGLSAALLNATYTKPEETFVVIPLATPADDGIVVVP